MPARVLRAELAGTIVQVNCRAGEAVEADGVVLVMESMKMEIPVCAPCAGRIVAVLVAEDEVVAEGQGLATLESR